MGTLVGVRDLKNKLSHYLREVKKGRCVMAVEKLKKLARSGLGTWSRGKPKGTSRSVVVNGRPAGDIVLEERR